MRPVLKVEQITKTFGGLTAVSGFDLALQPGQIAGIIGPNGAGKTTVFNLITGIYPVDRGSIVLGEREITNLPPDQIARAGIARTFQNIRLFGEMTVQDNIKMAFHPRVGYNLWEVLRGSKKYREGEARIEAESLTLLEKFGLAERRNELAKNLPYGEQRRLEIARALAARPQVLLLDEPAAGMNPKEVGDLSQLVDRIRQECQLAILLIEHQIPLVMELCDFVQVVDFGQTIAAGAPAEVVREPQVIQAYLGAEEDEAWGF